MLSNSSLNLWLLWQRVVYFVLIFESYRVDCTRDVDPLNDCRNPSNDFVSRGYLSNSYQVTHQHKPALLLSYPGSGNTWVRLLLEYSTGIYTGSIFNDTTLIPILPGEMYCSRNVSVVKSHPVDVLVEITEESTRQIHSKVVIPWKLYNDVCQHGNVESFTRFMIILRDPYRAFWSEYQRQRSSTKGKNDKEHNQGILKSNFNRKNWNRFLLRMTKEFATQWEMVYATIMKQFIHHKDYILEKYEDLVNPLLRYEVLQRMVQFIPFESNDERVKCAFTLADDPKAHRIIDKNKMVTIYDAYKSTELVCKVWEILRRRTNIATFGYVIWNNVSCKKENESL